MPAKYVRPYSKGQKNDFRDAEAIAEAVQRPTMKFVATKTADQLDLQALHRVRDRLVSQRTGVINQILSKDFAFYDINFQTFWLQKRKSNRLQIITFDLQRTAGPYKSEKIIDAKTPTFFILPPPESDRSRSAELTFTATIVRGKSLSAAQT
jgi:transposase